MNVRSDVHKIHSSTLAGSTPFGHDIIVVIPSPASSIYGTNSGHAAINQRWQDYLDKWMNEGHKIIVLMNAAISRQNLKWLPINEFALSNFREAGTSQYIGSVTSSSYSIKEFLKTNSQNFTVVTHYLFENEDGVHPNSSVDPTLLTSFTYKEGNKEIIFLPYTGMSNLDSLISALDTSVNKWELPEIESVEKELADTDNQITDLEAKRAEIQKRLSSLNHKVDDLINTDIYLGRSIRHYEAASNSQNPNPEDYYEAIEAIENAFTSERVMQSTLGFSKNFINKIMRRANEFRHVATSGEMPTPLTIEEIHEFNSNVREVILAYLKYLFDKK